MKFQKKATPPSELIPLLEERGLIIESPEDAIKCLTNIGYYRFSGYAHPFLEDKKEHIFLEGASFNKIINCYNFDRQLRFMLTEALHYIEISVRTIISDTMSLAINPHWFLNKSAFQSAYITKPKGYDKLLSIIAEKSGKLDKDNPIRMQNREDFIRHYYSTYTSPAYPPSWMIAEVLTFGDWSVIYSNLESKYKQDIAGKFNLHKYDLQSWMNSLSYLRNMCAHHSRVWNRNITMQPSKKGRNHQHLFIDSIKLYNNVIVMLILLKEIGYSGDWKERLINLIDEYSIDAGSMGFPANWQDSVRAWEAKGNI